MANQQTSRPWARLVTMVRPPPPPAAQPAPRPPAPPAIIRPTFIQPPPATPAPVQAAPASVQPAQTQAAPVQPSQAQTARVQAVASPKEPRPLVASPNMKSPPPRPPSPLTLPSPQLKPEMYEQQKTVLTQQTKEKPKTNSNNAADSKITNTTEDLRMRIITIAGENKGAIMDLGTTPFSKRNPRSSTDDHGDSKFEEGKSKTKSRSLMSAVMNSNVQGVNNSILYNSSTTHHDPGLHLNYSLKKPQPSDQIIP